MDHGCTEESEEGSAEGSQEGSTGCGGSEASQARQEVGDFA
jgi:hypothetical protein